MTTEFSRIQIVESPTRAYLPRPSAEILAAFEAMEGFSLPNSFKEFALRFGAGELAGDGRIYVPLECGIHNPECADLHAINAMLRRSEERPLASRASGCWPKFATRFVVFSGCDEFVFAWDRHRPTIRAECEYAICQLFGEEINEVSQTFGEFVEQCCNRRFWGADEPLQPKWTFTRFLHRN